MTEGFAADGRIQTAIAPWLSVRGGAQAVEFYRAAFGAVELHRVDDPDGNVVARLALGRAEFWLSDESPAYDSVSPGPAGASVRMILTVADPDAVFAQALKAGAEEISPITEGHGWRVGRLRDPFGHQWEIGRPDAS
jgi:PhnB protein